ncbi:hypothetical protein FRACYDRAFT_247192 [Fragilariopsis cylindrus CCMP1102]|uniref:Uncharacterized protein n=1 Tax=Fragilariopsis cylindrus CCMP1102 TaxID=635003 RepID=A0A1E7EX83_9STRA|nr:hypothetical protein FRACYDRAFT_247192 [Fragilariopsis cylindrus CCMP1102]|eukprot:OEU10650.1 hypothetical protein FRACYDRAFT_247192 [Fragilariopsis cylindrus CCMP1102]
MYFHTEDSMTRLFRAIIMADKNEDDNDNEDNLWLSSSSSSFPQHLGQIIKNCIDNGSLFKHYLWRFLCLYVYGGIYINDDFSDFGADSDAESVHNNNNDYIEIILRQFNSISSTIIHDNDNDDADDKYDGDTVLLILENNDNDNDNKDNSSILNTNIIAVTPRHPLMYYAIHHMIFKIVYNNDSDSLPSSSSGGGDGDVINDVLQKALADFRSDYRSRSNDDDSSKKEEDGITWNDINKNEDNRIGRKIIYHGTDNKTATIIGTSTITATTTLGNERKERLYNSLRSQSSQQQQQQQMKSSCLHKMFADSM